MPFSRLKIYLNDHLAMMTGEIELLRRVSASRRLQSSSQLQRLQGEVEEQRKAAAELLAAIGGQDDRMKQGVAWLAEKVGRLKLNGSLVKASPLSALLELEMLSLAASNRVALWEAIERLSSNDPRFTRLQWTQLRDQSRAQQHTLDELRKAAIAPAFEDSSASS